MDPNNLPEKVYHGTDEASAESIRRIGLDEQSWRAAGGGTGVDDKGLSVPTNRSTAEIWAWDRSRERGGLPGGVVLEADAKGLPLRAGSPGEWTDPDELFIPLEDFGQVGPGVFR
jgi:hypothetical protein